MPSCGALRLKMRLFQILRSLFRRKKKLTKRVLDRADLSDRLDMVLRSLRSELKGLLVTRTAPAGEIKKSGDWKLTKTAVGLFRLDSPNSSVLLNTEAFLLRKDGKINGLVRIREADLCQALQEGSPQKILDYVESVPGHSRELMSELRGKGATQDRALDADLLTDFDAGQLITKAGSMLIGRALVPAEGPLEKKIRKNLSVRLIDSIADDLESLLDRRKASRSGDTAGEILELESALEQFRAVWSSYLIDKTMREMRENARRKSNESNGRGTSSR